MVSVVMQRGELLKILVCYLYHMCFCLCMIWIYLGAEG